MYFNLNLGNNSKGNSINIDFTKQDVRFVLLNGVTGSGKSVFHNYLYNQIIDKNSPDEVQFIIMDMARVDFYHWAGDYLQTSPICKTIDGIRKLKELADQPSNEEKVTILHIEECDMFANAKREAEAALLQVLESRSDIHIVYSTNRPDRSVVTPRMVNRADLKVVFKLANHIDSNHLLGSEAALNLKKPGEKIIAYNRRQIHSAPLNEEIVEDVEDFKPPEDVGSSR